MKGDHTVLKSSETASKVLDDGIMKYSSFNTYLPHLTLCLSPSLSTNPTTSSHFLPYLYFCHFIAPHSCLSLFTPILCITSSHVCRMCEAPTWTRCQSQRKQVKRNWKACDYRKLQQAIRVNPLGQWLFFFLCLLVHAHCVWICNYKTSVQCEAICRPTTGCDSEL